MPPAPPSLCSDIGEASAYDSSCLQAGYERISEDCLFLKVWTPGLGDGGTRPVMLYIHGGAYASDSGSSPLYDGARLAAKGDVVVITDNAAAFYCRRQYR
ncbi:MAG: carboxylesterase family protein [Amphiplicatus sp.]